MTKQYHKSIYLDDYQEGKGSTFSIAFGEDEFPLYQYILPMSSIEIKSILGISHYKELKIMAEKENRTVNQYIKFKIALNMKQPKTKISTKDVKFFSS